LSTTTKRIFTEKRNNGNMKDAGSQNITDRMQLNMYRWYVAIREVTPDALNILLYTVSAVSVRLR
jgi:hypothetical protein